MAVLDSEPLQRLATSFDAYLEAVQTPALLGCVRDHDLRHIAFWHDYYAETLGTLAAGRAPTVLSGTYKMINRTAQLHNAEVSNDVLLTRLERAQREVTKAAAQLPSETMIPYKKGSRLYDRDAYIGVVSEHFDMHVRYLHGIAQGAPESTWVFHI